MDINEIRKSGLLEYYVLGLLSEAEAQKVEGYLVQYPELQADYLEIQRAMQAYAREQGIEPKIDLEQKVVDIVKSNGDTNVVQNKKSISSNAKDKSSSDVKSSNDDIDWKSLALPALLAAALFFSWYGFTKNAEYTDLQKEYVSYKENCENQLAEIERKRTIYANVNSPDTKTIELTPTDGYQESNLLFHNNTVVQKNYIQIKNLPQIAGNQAFQLWSLKDGVDPMPLTVFKDGDDLIIPVDYEAGTGTYAITIEDEQGASVPTLTRLIGTIGV